jgi:hypothetical protein
VNSFRGEINTTLIGLATSFIEFKGTLGQTSGSVSLSNNGDVLVGGVSVNEKLFKKLQSNMTSLQFQSGSIVSVAVQYSDRKGVYVWFSVDGKDWNGVANLVPGKDNYGGIFLSTVATIGHYNSEVFLAAQAPQGVDLTINTAPTKSIANFAFVAGDFQFTETKEWVKAASGETCDQTCSRTYSLQCLLDYDAWTGWPRTPEEGQDILDSAGVLCFRGVNLTTSTTTTDGLPGEVSDSSNFCTMKDFANVPRQGFVSWVSHFQATYNRRPCDWTYHTPVEIIGKMLPDLLCPCGSLAPPPPPTPPEPLQWNGNYKSYNISYLSAFASDMAKESSWIATTRPVVLGESVYYSVTVGEFAEIKSAQIGVVTSFVDLSSALGSNGSISLTTDGTIVADGSKLTQSELLSFTTGDVVDVAITFGKKSASVWFSVNGQDWNGMPSDIPFPAKNSMTLTIYDQRNKRTPALFLAAQTTGQITINTMPDQNASGFVFVGGDYQFTDTHEWKLGRANESCDTTCQADSLQCLLDYDAWTGWPTTPDEGQAILDQAGVMCDFEFNVTTSSTTVGPGFVYSTDSSVYCRIHDFARLPRLGAVSWVSTFKTTYHSRPCAWVEQTKPLCPCGLPRPRSPPPPRPRRASPPPSPPPPPGMTKHERQQKRAQKRAEEIRQARIRAERLAQKKAKEEKKRAHEQARMKNVKPLPYTAQPPV